MVYTDTDELAKHIISDIRRGGSELPTGISPPGTMGKLAPRERAARPDSSPAAQARRAREADERQALDNLAEVRRAHAEKAARAARR